MKCTYYFKKTIPLSVKKLYKCLFCNGITQISLQTQTYFRSSLLSTRKVTSANYVCVCFDVGQSDQRIEYSSSESLRLRSLACLGFWRELLNTLCNVNFTTITRFPATLNATITTGWQQHATASWEATTGNTSVSAGYHTRIRCNAKKNNNNNKNGQTMR